MNIKQFMTTFSFENKYEYYLGIVCTSITAIVAVLCLYKMFHLPFAALAALGASVVTGAALHLIDFTSAIRKKSVIFVAIRQVMYVAIGFVIIAPMHYFGKIAENSLLFAIPILFIAAWRAFHLWRLSQKSNGC